MNSANLAGCAKEGIPRNKTALKTRSETSAGAFDFKNLISITKSVSGEMTREKLATGFRRKGIKSSYWVEEKAPSAGIASTWNTPKKAK
jgi:hypothetical protein